MLSICRRPAILSELSGQRLCHRRGMERRHADPDRRAQHRALILEHVAAGDVGVDEAARILGLSTRQVGRLLARYVADPMDLVHGNRGRVPANRIPAATRAQLVELVRTRYAGVNHAHLVELLAEREGLVVAERTLRRKAEGRPDLPVDRMPPGSVAGPRSFLYPKDQVTPPCSSETSIRTG
jgi:transposase